jgi:S1-C subfamily serine protease
MGAESTAVPVNGGSMLVVIVPTGADAKNPKLLLGSRELPIKVVGHDPVSRLGFIQVDAGVAPKALDWVEDVGTSSGAYLQVPEAGGSTKCRATGWVKQVGGKILPFALLRVNFSHSVPPPGTPLLDEAGRIVAIVFQGVGSGNAAYAIPAEAVRRVRRDIGSGGKLVRGWLGLALRAESQIPQISRVLPDSPASAAGIRPNDVLLSIGNRQITDYADAANAFFYLIPGQPVRVKLLRGVEPLEFTLTPTKPKD